jgi:chloramphenicol O-acetyltransferase
MISIDGLMVNICRALESSDDAYSAAYAYTVCEMVSNLKELKSRKSEGEVVIDEFFSLYVLDEDK